MKTKQPTKKDVNTGAQISKDIEDAIFEILLSYKPDPRIGMSAIIDVTIRVLRALGQCLDVNPDEFVIECLEIGIKAVREKVGQPKAGEQ